MMPITRADLCLEPNAVDVYVGEELIGAVYRLIGRRDWGWTLEALDEEDAPITSGLDCPTYESALKGLLAAENARREQVRG
jgi:hypothetical protein